jgi:hypothetical protein
MLFLNMVCLTVALAFKLWKFDDEGRLVNKTGLVADIEGGDGEEGASVIGWERNDDDEAENQKWR